MIQYFKGLERLKVSVKKVNTNEDEVSVKEVEDIKEDVVEKVNVTSDDVDVESAKNLADKVNDTHDDINKKAEVNEYITLILAVIIILCTVYTVYVVFVAPETTVIHGNEETTDENDMLYY